MTIVLDARTSAWKGKSKERAYINPRDEGTGGNSGIVLNMDMVSTSYFGVAYTVPVQVGSTGQNISLQVDTGSSDLWIASKSCSTASCSSTNGRLYDPSSSRDTGVTFNIQYLLGNVSGPVVWDEVQIGGYTILNQALAAATNVQNEPLTSDFDGILGLALPLNSIISQLIPASTTNNPDGAALSSNLFAITPTTDAPSQAFFSLMLARPGSSALPSLLGIGRHPAGIVPDPTKIQYSPLVSESVGTLFWKTNIRAITVYINGQARPVALQAVSGAVYPTALLDSGVPLIITTSEIANGIYGALGISPGSNGQYYVPCNMPLNMTITLDSQPELPLHPLDLTAEPSGQSGSQYCIGLIQTADAQLTPTSDIGDMILGVPFMRNVYTVMAYEKPNANGVFNESVHNGTSPTLGLLGLTNITQALEQFHNVRVLNQPLDGGQSQQSAPPTESEKKMSVGIEVLIGLISFFVLCLALFALRCFLARRRFKKRGDGQVESDGDQKFDLGSYQLTRRNSRSSADEGGADTLRTLAYDSFARKEKVSQYTVDSNRTRVEDPGSEFGLRKSKMMMHTSPNHDLNDPWDPYGGTWRDTIVGTDAGTPMSPEFPQADISALNHQHTQSELMSTPLLGHRDNESQGSDLAEFGMAPFMSMAGVGTAARGSLIDTEFRHSRMRSDSSGQSAQSTMPLRNAFSSSRLSQEPRTSDEHSDAVLSDPERTTSH